MTYLNTNDNQPARARRHAPTPDAMGQASLLLVESLIHGLIARSVITVTDAVEAVEVATEVTQELVDERSDDQAAMGRSLRLLASIRASLSHDLPAARTGL